VSHDRRDEPSRAAGSVTRVMLCADTIEADDRAWIDKLATRWPDASRAVIGEAVPLDAAVTAPESETPPHAVVVRADRCARPALLRRVVHALMDRSTPAVVLAPDPGAIASETEEAVWRCVTAAAGDGLAALPGGIEPGRAALAVHSMLRRQPAVERVREDLELARAAGRGLRHELNTLHDELRRAAKLQRDLVDRVDRDIPGLSVGVVNRPAAYVSGDLFTIERLDAEHAGVFLADVTGHGVSAAMMTLFISRSLPRVEGGSCDGREGPLPRRIVPPGEALERLNHAVCESGGNGLRFATAVYAVIHTPTGRVRLASAGHPPPLLVSGEHGAVRLDEGGPLLGVFWGEGFPERAFELRTGQSLVIYTDGFESAFGSNEGPSGREHLDRLTAIGSSAARGGDAAIGVEELEAMLDTASGSLSPLDDVTAVVISPKAEARRAACDRAMAA